MNDTVTERANRLSSQEFGADGEDLALVSTWLGVSPPLPIEEDDLDEDEDDDDDDEAAG